MRLKKTFVAMVSFLIVGNLPATDTAIVAEHAALQEWQFSSTSVAVENLTWTADAATWILESGHLRFMKPTTDGATTGIIFEGLGRFKLQIADSFEIDQLRRFSGNPDLDGVDEGFSRLVLRTSGPLPSVLPPAPPGATYQPDDVAKKRHENRLHHVGHDVDARVLVGLNVHSDPYLVVDMETDSYDWIVFEFEPWRDEEIALYKHQRQNDYIETWVSLDRAEHRIEDGRPSSLTSYIADLQHLEIEVDLSEHKGGRIARAHSREKDWARFRAVLTLKALQDGVEALEFRLHPRAKLTNVTTKDGSAVDVLRDHIGRRFLTVENGVWDSTVSVFPGRRLDQGEPLGLVFEYELEIYNYGSGLSWYPTIEHSGLDLHTAKMDFHLPKKAEVWAVGQPAETQDSRDDTWATWIMDIPTRMVGFTFGKDFREERLKVDGVPEVVVLGDPAGFSAKKKLRNVGADIVNSMNFYQQYFDFEFPDETFFATSIESGHGQAFDGFLHLSQYTFDSNHPGASELFRAHEVAHQIWGHLVGWQSYRDQWLSESFAEYSAMLFVQASLPDKGFFEEILEVYTAEQLGSFKGSMSKFARPWNVDQVRRYGEEMGPIAAGYRAGSATTPLGGTIQLYRKGPLVLHMIHFVLNTMGGGNQDPFRTVMQEFIRRHTGREATTEDFQSLLDEMTGNDWTPIFDSWIYGSGTPTFTWSHNLQNNENGPVLVINIAQSGVPEGFSTLLPLRIIFSGNRAATNLIPMNTAQKTVHISLPAEPVAVILNPEFAVPARFVEE
ncbi:MAG: hypothetical protein K8R59_17785 [Thermoanaerobaculales bacterium]|nr:hypothetical protein [Thermoanaerobaculales bacterium]